MSEFPRLLKIKNGHTLQVFPVYEQGEGLEEIVFWCHTCDKTGENVVTSEVRDRNLLDVYKELVDIAEWHAEQ